MLLTKRMNFNSLLCLRYEYGEFEIMRPHVDVKVLGTYKVLLYGVSAV
jgi:hypothetical protein